MRRLLPLAALATLVVAATAAGFWAGRVALAPPDDPLTEQAAPVTYEVVEQTIGQALQFAAVADWEAMPLARAWAPGVVTSVDFAPGDAVDVGDALFTVNLRPVVIARGEVPAFRDLKVGDTGADVLQLETLLAELTFLEAEPAATFDEATAAAVRAWQRSLGVVGDGIVRHGDVLFTPELPVRILATEALQVGAALSGGEVVIDRLSSAPSVVVPLTPDQRNLVPLSGSVQLTYPEGTWEAVIAQAAENAQGGINQVDLVLEAPGGGPVCGDACATWIPAEGRTNFQAAIVVVPETTGPVVPVAAIVTDPGGGQAVRREDGTDVSIDVLASTGGLAVVRGIEVGDVVLLPFAEPPER